MSEVRGGGNSSLIREAIKHPRQAFEDAKKTVKLTVKPLATAAKTTLDAIIPPEIPIPKIDFKEIIKAADITPQKAWERAKPVLRTALGGAILYGSALVTKDFILPNLARDFMGDKGMSQALMIFPSILTLASGLGGAAITRKPVQDAYNYFKARIFNTPQ